MKEKEILDKIENILVGNAHLDELASKVQDPFKILISTILSARTKDANTKTATETLFSVYKTPKQIAEADVEELEKLIYKTGFYKVKATRIKEVSRIIQEDHAGKVPQDFERLIRLPGVGAKTANCVLVYAFKIPSIPVDTHVHRISNRIGWVNTKSPDDTEESLKTLLPKDQWLRINRILVKFGQQICFPNKPRCNLCPIEANCPRDFSKEVKKRKKKPQ